VVDETTLRPPADVRLYLPSGYVVLSPISRVLDALSLLSISQQVAILLTLVLITIAWHLIFARSQPLNRVTWPIISCITGLALLDALAIAIPRPMASLAVSDPTLVRIDFHSHTNASHDARSDFTAERNREWHHDGGFDAAYISDHRSYAGAALGEARNPARAGDATVLLPALEARYHGLSTVILGIRTADSALVDPRRHLLSGTLQSGREPQSIAVLPGPIFDMAPVARDDPPQITGLELVDGAPKGLGQLDREENEIRGRSSALGLTLVAGSNNHGWGRTVSAWNLMHISNWRQLTPDSLEVLIEAGLHARRPDEVRVVARIRPHSHGMSLPLTAPAVVVQTLEALTPSERLSWIVWIWLLTFVAIFARRPQRSPPT
jgi:hypothetical protein